MGVAELEAERHGGVGCDGGATSCLVCKHTSLGDGGLPDGRQAGAGNGGATGHLVLISLGDEDLPEERCRSAELPHAGGEGLGSSGVASCWGIASARRPFSLGEAEPPCEPGEAGSEAGASGCQVPSARRPFSLGEAELEEPAPGPASSSESSTPGVPDVLEGPCSDSDVGTSCSLEGVIWQEVDSTGTPPAIRHFPKDDARAFSWHAGTAATPMTPKAALQKLGSDAGIVWCWHTQQLRAEPQESSFCII